MPRAIDKSSAPQLARLHALCFEEAWGDAAIAGLLAMPGVFGFMWGPEAAPEGFVLARLGGGEAEILTICVAPARRRAGTGRLLLQAAAAYALASGADALFLEVAEDNPAALRLYERFGFTSVGIRPAYYARGASRVAARTLRLDLPPSIALS